MVHKESLLGKATLRGLESKDKVSLNEWIMPRGSGQNEYLTSLFPPPELCRGSLLAEPNGKQGVRESIVVINMPRPQGESRVDQKGQMEDIQHSLSL